MELSGKITNGVSDSIPYIEISDLALLAKKPLISVKMITYNHEPYIAQAIEGVLQQKTDFPIELVIGEDCSTDRTREIVLCYQKKYPSLIRVLISDKNVGGHKNSRRTHKACRGKYIAFCEGDDYWHHPDKLQMQVEYLETHPEYGMVHSDIDRYIVNTGEMIPSFHKKEMLLHKNAKILNVMITNEYFVETCSVVVRKDLLDKIRETCQFEFSEIFPMGDIQMWIEIAYRSKLKYIDASLSTRNMLPESASQSKNIEKRIKFLKSVRAILIHYANKYGGEDTIELKKKIYALFGVTLINLACHACNSDIAREVLEKSRKNHVSIKPLSYLYFLGSQNIIASHLIRLLVLSASLSRKMILSAHSSLKSLY
jgi:glycosyltransferase involved in cell wall biosynthesis